MDNKGIDLTNINPVLIMQIKSERKLPAVIKPVTDSAKSELNTPMDRPGYGPAESYEDALVRGAGLADAMLPKELRATKRYRMKWRINDETGELLLEITDKRSGEVVRVLTQKEVEQVLREEGKNEDSASYSGSILDKSA
ncbi:MAG: hypothetical protein M0022_00440 [Desulfobacteraceae bacterium]|nr:hypothetical protein [Desulfobacteraceae bacterium]